MNYNIADADWTLVWSDEFDQPGSLDPTKWTAVCWEPGRVNQELQSYSDRPQNIYVANGSAHLVATYDEQSGAFTSARLTTAGKFSFLYGRVEFRARLPRGRGTWPALWMMPEAPQGYGAGWPEAGEIDVMEHVGHEPEMIHSTVHTGAYNWPAGTQKGDKQLVPGVWNQWHTYRVDWSEDALVFSVDERTTFTFQNERTGWKAWPFDRPFHLIMNFAVGGGWGGARGVDERVFPAELEVDWVRVYQRP